MTGWIPGEDETTTESDIDGDYDPNHPGPPATTGSGRSWSDLVLLKTLYLDHNQLTGRIPSEFLEGLAPSLEQLDLGSNRLVGEIPSRVGKMTVLEILDLQSNKLTGKLPPEMNRMHIDVKLNLTDNL